MSDPVQECLNALDALYNHPDPAIKHAADLWLIGLQKQKVAWQVADQLLHRASLPEHAYYFAANTLHSKLLFSCGELADATQRRAFRDSLVTHIHRFKNGSNTVKTRLALCVACLGVHLVGLGEWSSCIDELIQMYGPDPSTALLLLDILNYLPEETHNPKLLIPGVVRARAQQEMLRATSTILALLMHFLAVSSAAPASAAAAAQAAQTGTAPAATDYISSGILRTPNTGLGAVLLPAVSGPQRELQRKILACFLSWVKATGYSRRFDSKAASAALAAAAASSPSTASLLSSTNLIAHPLLLFCFKLIASRCEELEQIAIDVLGSLLKNFNFVADPARWSGGVSNGGGFGGGFRQASDWSEDGDEDEEGQFDRFSPEPQGSPSAASAAAAAAAAAPSPYEHLYFMRWMVQRILELVPLFDALPSPAPGVSEEDDLHPEDGELARCYSRLFVDLGEYYLDFIMEFCVGTVGFQGPHDARQIEFLQRTIMEHARAAQAQPALLAASPNPQSPHSAAAAAAAAVTPPTSAEVEALIVSNQELAFQIVQVVLKCSAHPRRSVYANSLYFWFRLSESLCGALAYGGTGGPKRNASAAAAAPATGPAVLSPLQIRQKKKETFFPIFVQMVPNLHRMMTYPPNFPPARVGHFSSNEQQQQQQQPQPAGPISAEEEEEIRKIRHQAAETLLDLEKLVGYERILELLCSDAVMGAQFHAFVSSSSSSGSTPAALRWQELESSLFCIRSLSARVCDGAMLARSHMGAAQGFAQGGSTNLVLVPKILDLLLDPNSPVMKSQPIKYTALNILAGYAAWIREHGESQQAQAQQQQQQPGAAAASAAVPSSSPYLYKALSCVVTCLSDPSVCGAAARALNCLCEQNREVIANSKPPNPSYLPNLMQVYKQCCSVSVVGAGKNQSGLTLDDQKQIIEGVAAVVSCVNSQAGAAANGGKDDLPHYLQEMVAPMIEEIQKILAWAQQHAQPLPPTPQEIAAAAAIRGGPAGAAAPAPATSAGVSLLLPQELSLSLSSHLDRLSETFAKLSPVLNPNKEHFISCLLELVNQVIAPLLYRLMHHFSNDEKRMDKLCRIFKWIIKTTRLHFMPQGLQPLIQHLHAAFTRHPHACFLYLLSVCIDYFGAHPHFQPIVAQILPMFLARSLATIPSTQAMVNDPDMTEDFFETCTKISKNCPDILFQLPILPQIIEHLVFGLCLHHRDSLSAVTHFLALFLEHGIDSPSLNKSRMTPPVPEHVRVIQQCMHAYGAAICKQLILDISGAIPAYRLSMLMGPLEGVLGFCGEGCHMWLMESLRALPTETVDPTKQEFMEGLLRFQPYRSPQGQLRDLVHRFSDACRIQDA